MNAPLTHPPVAPTDALISDLIFTLGGVIAHAEVAQIYASIGHLRGVRLAVKDLEHCTRRSAILFAQVEEADHEGR